MSFDEVIAQPVAVRVLSRAVERGRIAESYLFEGPSGVGKTRTAIALAQAVLCPVKPNKGCGECAVCTRAADGSHPDVRTFQPREDGNRNIQVEYLREEILPFAQYAPFEAEAAFLIFPEADVSFPARHPESANALLKTLEEPRPGVHFVLLSERPDRLLPTIRSRCQNVRFSRLPTLVLERILKEHQIPEAKRAPAVALADGRADRALALAESGTAESVLDQAMAIDRSILSKKPGSLVSIAEKLAKDDDLVLTLETLATFYRDVAALSLGVSSEGISFRHRWDEVRDRAAVLTPARAAARVEMIRRTVDTFERNANKHIALDALLFSLREA